MKAFLIVLASLFISSMASAELNGLAEVNCAYKDGKKTKKPVVTLSTVYSGDNFNPKITLSVAYFNENGVKVIENAIATEAYYTESFEGYVIEAVTTSLKTMTISIYVETGESYIDVDGIYQDHMNQLTCEFFTAG